MTYPAAAWVLMGGAGLSLGSYATTAALRWADGRQSTFGRSQCDHCGVVLSFASTTPVVSFILRKGTCAACGGRIDPLHTVGELAGALIVVSAFCVAPPLRAALLSVLGLVLLVSAVYDAKTRRLPDGLTLSIALAALALAASRSTDALAVGVLAAVIAFALLEAVRRLFLQLRGRPGLGFGDVKLIAALAPWTALSTPWVVVVAAVLGLVVMALRPSHDGRLAFGPYVAVAAWAVGIAGEGRLCPALA